MPEFDPSTIAAIAALNGGGGGGLGGVAGLSPAGSTGADLANFQKSIAANDPWNMALAPVAATKLNTSTWTPNQALAGTLGQAAITAVLRALGQHSEENQLAAAVQVLPQLYKDPAGTPVPEGVDPSAFNALRFSAIGRQATTDDLIRRALGEKGIMLNPDGTANTDVLAAANKAGGKNDAKSLTPQATQKLATAQGLLSQLEQAKQLVKQFQPNPDLGVVGKIPILGDLASEYVGSSERGVQGARNYTPEGLYNALMQSVYEGAGKFISNTARQKVIDENKALTDPAKMGTPAGTMQALQNVQNIIREDLLAQAQGYSEQDYKNIVSAVDAANTIGVNTQPQQQYEIRTAPNGKQYKVLLGQ